ncbi:MAG: DUF4258 domain-containing protein [Ignavibacteria bacterium]|nr:DUF4258 domain-containing protein [Ignavibacteria bacterium]
MPPINIIEHALERMKQRGVSESEVRTTINTGKIDIAKYGRVKFTKSFNLRDTEKKKSYTKKMLLFMPKKQEVKLMSFLF